MCSVLSFYLLWNEKVRNKIKQRCPDWFYKVLPPEFCCLVEAGVLDETLCTRVSSIMADRWLHFRSTQAYLPSVELLGSQCHDSERPESPSQRVPEETPRIFDLGQAPVLPAWQKINVSLYRVWLMPLYPAFGWTCFRILRELVLFWTTARFTASPITHVCVRS